MINKFQRIVVPSDFSDTAQEAVELGAGIAVWYGAKLDLVNSVDATVYAYAGYPFASLSKELISSAEDAINRVQVPDFAKDLKVNRYVLSGNPAAEVVEHVKRNNADLIVVGTHGHGPVARFLLGSVADRVVHEAPCPVIVTKPLKAKAGSHKGKNKPVSRILFPTDFSPTANAALHRAIALTQDFDAELFVLHVVDDTLISTHVEEERQIILKELRRHALDEMHKQLPAELLQNFETMGAVKRGEPGKQICAHAETHACDLIVMGTHGRTGVGRLLLGSVADKVLRGARCPVFIERFKV